MPGPLSAPNGDHTLTRLVERDRMNVRTGKTAVKRHGRKHFANLERERRVLGRIEREDAS